MVDPRHDGTWDQVLIWLQLLLYCSLRYIFSHLALLATFANFFSVRSVYLALDTMSDKSIPSDKRMLMAGLYVMVVACLVFSTLEMALAYAILTELKLFECQYVVNIGWKASLSWAAAFLCTEFTPIAIIAVTLDYTFQHEPRRPKGPGGLLSSGLSSELQGSNSPS